MLDFLLRPILEAFHSNFRDLRNSTEKFVSKYTTQPDSNPELQQQLPELLEFISRKKQRHIELLNILKQCSDFLNKLKDQQGDQLERQKLLVYIYAYCLDTNHELANQLAIAHPQLALMFTDKLLERKELINEVLVNQNFEMGLAWCKEKRSYLVAANCYIEEKMKVQYFLLKLKDAEWAADFAKRNFGKLKSVNSETVRDIIACLYDESRVEKLRAKFSVSESDFERALECVSGIGGKQRLEYIVNLGMAVYKSPACIPCKAQPNHNTDSGTDSTGDLMVDDSTANDVEAGSSRFFKSRFIRPGCPACNPELSNLVAQTPSMVPSISRLDGELILTPDNCVFEVNKLPPSGPNNKAGKIVMPRTNGKFDFINYSETKRVFSA